MPGFIRYKFDNLSIGEQTVSATILGNTYSKTIRVKEFCTGSLYLKYLDKNGQYRFFICNKYYEKRDTPKLIGSTDKTINELITAQSNKRNVGYTNERIINAYAEGIPQDELDKLADMYTSPRVYLYIGTSTDELKDWLLVTVKEKTNPLKKKKGSFYSIDLEIALPETYTIRML